MSTLTAAPRRRVLRVLWLTRLISIQSFGSLIITVVLAAVVALVAVVIIVAVAVAVSAVVSRHSSAGSHSVTHPWFVSVSLLTSAVAFDESRRQGVTTVSATVSKTAPAKPRRFDHCCPTTATCKPANPPRSSPKPTPRPRIRFRDCNRGKLRQSHSGSIQKDSLEMDGVMIAADDATTTTTARGESASSLQNLDYNALESHLRRLALSCFVSHSPKKHVLSSERCQSLRGRTKHGAGNGASARLQRKSPPVPLPIYCVYSTKERLYCHRASGSSDSSHLSSSRDGRHSDNNVYQHYTMEDGSNSSASSRFAPNTYDESTDDDAEYAVPPDAAELRDSSSDLKCVLQRDDFCNGIISSIEKQGYLNKFNNKGKSWKKRWFVLKEDVLQYYLSQEDVDVKEPLGKINFAEVISLSRSGRMAADGFDIRTAKGIVRLMGDQPKTCREWFRALQKCRKNCIFRRFREMTEDVTARGWITKVHYGRSKRYWCTLCGNSLLFFKRPTAKVPRSYLCLEQSKIREAPRSSEDESDASDGLQSSQQYSIELTTAEGDSVYLIFLSGEDKERWLYHIEVASVGGPKQYGTPFEQLINRLIKVDGPADSLLWKDPLMTVCDEYLSAPLTNVKEESDRKAALNLYKSVYLFSTVAIHGGAEDYHVDLSQNALQLALNSPGIREEFFCQLIKFINSHLLSHQTWQLLALCLSLFTPVHYPIMWLLKKFLQNQTSTSDLTHRFAAFCRRALERTLRNGNRNEPPSRLEVLAFLLRDPCEHSLPHSIPVNLPDTSYQVIGFDGSSTVEECMLNLCQITSLRHSKLSGYCLFADDPGLPNVLQPLDSREKLCDVLSRWERSLKEFTSGKVPTRKAVRLYFRLRYYWGYDIPGETEQERIYLAYQVAEDMKAGHIPLSTDLAVEASALLAQMHFGPCKGVNDNRIEDVINQSLSEKVVAVSCKNVLKQQILKKWCSYQRLSPFECATAVIKALRVWPYFGAKLFEALMKGKTEESVWLAVDGNGISILSYLTMDCMNTYAYDMLLKFGGINSDFVLVVLRQFCSEEESSMERLVFAMDSFKIYEITVLIADYISNQPKGIVRLPPTSTLPEVKTFSVNV